MNIQGKHYRTIWLKKNDPTVVQIIDQRHLPHRFVIEDLTSLKSFTEAIRDMHVRGAPLIGATAAYGMYMAALRLPEDGLREGMEEAARKLKATRPTAVDLSYAVDRVLSVTAHLENDKDAVVRIALETANAITEESVSHCRLIGEFGVQIIDRIHHQKVREGRPPVVNILTHCNAGWLACIDFGSATAPIYAAFEKNIPVHVWVDETRPRNQGARLTAFELQEHGVDHTVIADNTGGHLMQHSMVDLVITGTDRTTRTGDVANKIGTYLKALAANDNAVPFYVAAPSSSIDWDLRDGLREIPIEERGAEEVKRIGGLDPEGEIREVLLTPEKSKAANFGFDVTPARLVTGLITERGICPASEEGLMTLFPEKKQ